jgi:cytochrome c biogenesis protein CcmG/thiol:disulfide interchange protein DsbE
MEASPTEETHRSLSPAWMAAGVIALLVLGLLVYALFAQPVEPPVVGGPVPGFELDAIDGTLMKLDGPGDQVTVVNFFASWCAPCRQEAPDLEQTWRDYQDRGVQFYAIAYKDAGSKARAFQETYDVSYPYAVDPGNRISRVYGVTGVPETFVIDRDGLLVHHFVGPVTQSVLSQAIEEALAP